MKMTPSLVEDQDLRPEVHGTGDGHRLALPAREGSYRLRGVTDVYAHPAQLLARDPVREGSVVVLEGTDSFSRFPSEEEVARDAHERDHREVLIDGGYPAVEGVARRGEADLLALAEDLALVGLVDAGERLDQGGLPRAVVAEEAHHLAGADAHGDVLEGDDAPEVLRDALHLDEGGCRLLRRHLDLAALLRM